MQYCRITEIYSTFLSCLRNGQHPAGCSQPFVFAIRLHPVSRDIPSQSECLNGCVVPLQLRILGTTRGEIVQAEGVYNCCSCSLKCSDLQRGKIKRKGSATCENQTSQYIQFDTSILMLQCCVCVCCAFGKGHAPAAHLSDQAFSSSGTGRTPCGYGKPGRCVPLDQE